MSRHGEVDIEWAGGSHTFRLGLAEVEELEAGAEMSVFLMLQAMSSKIPMARLKHYSETIRLGLIGGGMKPMEARALTTRYVDQRPLDESVALAEAVLLAAVRRPYTSEVEDAVGEDRAVDSSASISPPSTEAQP